MCVGRKHIHTSVQISSCVHTNIHTVYTSIIYTSIQSYCPHKYIGRQEREEKVQYIEINTLSGSSIHAVHRCTKPNQACRSKALFVIQIHPDLSSPICSKIQTQAHTQNEAALTKAMLVNLKSWRAESPKWVHLIWKAQPVLRAVVAKKKPRINTVPIYSPLIRSLSPQSFYSLYPFIRP